MSIIKKCTGYTSIVHATGFCINLEEGKEDRDVNLFMLKSLSEINVYCCSDIIDKTDCDCVYTRIHLIARPGNIVASFSVTVIQIESLLGYTLR